jgi:hypothetical protein
MGVLDEIITENAIRRRLAREAAEAVERELLPITDPGRAAQLAAQDAADAAERDRLRELGVRFDDDEEEEPDGDDS